jgi:O-antigen ligase
MNTSDNRLRSGLRAVLFVLLTAPVIVAPWFFGAWEQWWFWVFMTPLALAVAVFGALLSTGGVAVRAMRPLLTIGLAAVPFLAYLLLRAGQAPVVMEAQRMALLHITGWLVAGMVAFGLERRHRRLLWAMMVANLTLLGIYGIVNHAVTGSRYVLWTPGFAQYYLDGRASGSYYCPNHFAGIMEILFALAGAGCVARGISTTKRTGFGLAACVALLAIVVSRSRGGMLTIGLLTVLLGVWGLRPYPPDLRWSWRALGVSVCGLALFGFCHLDSGFRDRFVQYVGEQTPGAGLRAQAGRFFTERFPVTSRGRMFGGAWRAWKTAPWVGIGPGMHAIIWPHIAPTADGNRELGLWPSLTNEEFFSFEVHSDWLQLLEETGTLGLLLFLAPCLALLRVLLRAMRRENTSWRLHGWQRTACGAAPVVLAGCLAFWAMAFHSLGDFNLQMPATVWITAALLALAATGATTDASHSDKYANHHHQ